MGDNSASEILRVIYHKKDKCYSVLFLGGTIITFDKPHLPQYVKNYMKANGFRESNTFSDEFSRG